MPCGIDEAFPVSITTSHTGDIQGVGALARRRFAPASAVTGGGRVTVGVGAAFCFGDARAATRATSGAGWTATHPHEAGCSAEGTVGLRTFVEAGVAIVVEVVTAFWSAGINFGVHIVAVPICATHSSTKTVTVLIDTTSLIVGNANWSLDTIAVAGDAAKCAWALRGVDIASGQAESLAGGELYAMVASFAFEVRYALFADGRRGGGHLGPGVSGRRVHEDRLWLGGAYDGQRGFTRRGRVHVHKRI